MTSKLTQPLYWDGDTVRFKKNSVVRYLLDEGGNLNDIWMVFSGGYFSQEDMDQFYQLIGYSVSGYCEIDGLSEESKDEAWDKMQNMLELRKADRADIYEGLAEDK